MKALDIYLAFCFFMVFAALLEYASINYTTKRIQLNQRALREYRAQARLCTGWFLMIEQKYLLCALAWHYVSQNGWQNFTYVWTF